MNKMIFLLILVAIMYGYQWPMQDTLGNPDNKIVESNFGDYRAGHIHEGIDIPDQPNAQFDSLYIWPIDYAIVVYRTTYTVRIRHYPSSFDTAKDEGSRYLHANSDGICAVGDTLMLDDPVAKGWSFDPTYEPHLHLEYRAHGGDNLNDSRNPFVIGALQVTDTMLPILDHLYVDYSCHGDADVENLNFLSLVASIFRWTIIFRPTEVGRYITIWFVFLFLISDLEFVWSLVFGIWNLINI